MEQPEEGTRRSSPEKVIWPAIQVGTVSGQSGVSQYMIANQLLYALIIRSRAWIVSFIHSVACLLCRVKLFYIQRNSHILLSLWEYYRSFFFLMLILIYDRLTLSLGASGLFVGGVSGLFRSSAPGLFALASGIQWFALGTTFWGMFSAFSPSTDWLAEAL